MYSLYFLMHLSYTDMTEVNGIPHWFPPPFFDWLPQPGLFLFVIEPLMVCLLILLLVGLYTRPVTGLLIIVAGYWALLHHAYGGNEQLLTLMTFYVPVFGFFSQWGALYSVDAARRDTAPQPENSSPVYVWPAKGMLIIISLLFFTAGLYKVLRPGGWLDDPFFLQRFLQIKAVGSYLSNGSDISPLALFMSQHPLLTIPAQYGVLFFELSFPLVLFSGFVYNIYLRALPIFHLLNALLLGIPFLLVLPAYALLVDWQHVADELSLPVRRFQMIPVAPGIVLAGTALIALTWNVLPAARFIFGFGGLFDNNQTLWIALTIFVVPWYGMELWRYWQTKTTTAHT
jgi:hypothetical protein